MISVYIHIPFCNTICTYCDFCKLNYKKEWVLKYLEKLMMEIKTYYKSEKIKTLYIGGGTPSSLSIDELSILFDIISIFDLSELEEFTIECNVESLTKEKLILFMKNNVNRLSIGVQTFNNEYLKLLNRNHTKESVFEIVDIARIIGFDNINIDLMYALPNETIELLNEDIETILRLNPSHISCYSLMINENTKMYIDNVKPIDEDLDYEMYRLIEDKLKDSGYNHYEISNYSKPGYESKHNLVYWNNELYYGFGLGASGYLDNYRYDNTKNLSKYFKEEFIDKVYKIDDNDKIKYEFMLGFRKINGINKEEFFNKYNININDILSIKKLIDEEKLIDDNTNIFISDKWIYLSNEILVDLI